MSRRCSVYRWWPALLLVGVLSGCEIISNQLTKWEILDQKALENPLQAVGGNGMFFAPQQDDRPRTREQLVKATPQDLVDYYAPIFVQQRKDAKEQAYPYPPEYDYIGEAGLRSQPDGKFKAVVSGQPKVYAIYQKRLIGESEHVQITYTAWYPAHPRMKAIDLESADIDSIVLRITLDTQNAPLFYETIAACGCFHKIFVVKSLEEAAAATYGPPEKNKRFSVEKTVKDAIDWEVAGAVDSPRDQPRRPVVFVKAGDHKVIGMGSAARLRIPKDGEVHPYSLAEYSELYAVAVDNGAQKAPFFDVGGKVWGAERKERFVFSFIGVSDAGTPRANDQIKLHFDQSTWDDTTIYEKFLRLPPRVL
jgi:hypothetical protein